jgi:hypothetical protein
VYNDDALPKRLIARFLRESPKLVRRMPFHFAVRWHANACVYQQIGAFFLRAFALLTRLTF